MACRRSMPTRWRTRCIAPGTPGAARIVERFGPAVRRPTAASIGKTLGAIVFADPAARRDLEAIVHPAVVSGDQRRGSPRSPPVPFAVADIPLLYETGREARLRRGRRRRVRAGGAASSRRLRATVSRPRPRGSVSPPSSPSPRRRVARTTSFAPMGATTRHGRPGGRARGCAVSLTPPRRAPSRCAPRRRSPTRGNGDTATGTPCSGTGSACRRADRGRRRRRGSGPGTGRSARAGSRGVESTRQTASWMSKACGLCDRASRSSSNAADRVAPRREVVGKREPRAPVLRGGGNEAGGTARRTVRARAPDRVGRLQPIEREVRAAGRYVDGLLPRGDRLRGIVLARAAGRRD